LWKLGDRENYNIMGILNWFKRKKIEHEVEKDLSPTGKIVRVKEHKLADGHLYDGFGYYSEKNKFVPHKYGMKKFPDMYVKGYFQKGILNGPAIVSHDYYMYTTQMKNNRGNGWGLCINRGILTEFGLYENSILVKDFMNYVEWYFTRMRDSGRNENMLNIYTNKNTGEMKELFIGYPVTPFACGMGFHFTLDGSVWVGDTIKHTFTGNLIHFREDGQIDVGYFENAKLINRYDVQKLIEIYDDNSNEKVLIDSVNYDF